MKRDFQQLPSQATPMPYWVASLADLPSDLKQAAMHSVGSTDKPISICVFPGRTGLKSQSSWENIGEQALLFMEDGIFQIQAPASAHQEARIIYLRAAELLYARLSLILMYGRLDLVDESIARVVVEFNAAGFDIIRTGLQNLLSTSCGRNTVSIPDALLTKTLLDEIGELSYKFKNGLYLYGLLPGEQVEGFVFQPSLWGQRWHLFRLKIAETTLLALTDKQLIVVEEQSRSRFPAYGWIFTFYPRKAIKKIGVRPGRRWQELIIEMNSRTGLIDHRILLEQSNVSAWQELWSRDRQPTPAAS
jgi:hypothetical protein